MNGDDARLTRMSDMATLGQLSVGRAGVALEAVSGEAEALRVHPPEHFMGRSGYDPAFIEDFPVLLPDVTGRFGNDRAPLQDGSGTVLHYTNFSLEMSVSRRIAIYTACNLDGSTSKKIKRPRKDVWFFDGRISSACQVGDELYHDNELDKGHLVRREDPVWGEDAALANDDTYHYTNCSPQHAGLNQETWLGLENYILRNARVEGLRAAVFTGPVLAGDDPTYRNVRIPKEYWKVVAIRSEGRRSATAYVISQEEHIRGLEFFFGKYKTYQVSIRRVEELSGLGFGDLWKYDGFSNEEMATGVGQRVVLESWQSIRV